MTHVSHEPPVRIESAHGGHNRDPRRASTGAPAQATGQAGNPRQPHAQAAGRRGALPRHHRVRRDGHPAARQRDPVASQLHPARPARPGEEPHPPRPGRSARRADSGRAGLRDPRRPAGAALRGVPRAHRAGRRRHADRVAAARGALRREARDAGRDDRRHGRRHRSDQGRAGGPEPLRRADDALRPAAAGQPRHLRHQRAARSRGQDPGRPVQHPAGRRRPDQRLPDSPEARRHARVHGEPGRLHGARQDHHAAQGPHRIGNPHALSGDAPQRDGHHQAGSVDRARRRPRASRFPTTSARSSRKSRSRRAPIARSTSGPASASACRSRRSSSSCRTPNGARCPTARRSSCRA